MQLVGLRLADLAKVFRHRYGAQLPDDDAGRDDLALALMHLASLAHPRGHIAKWIDAWAPWLPAGEQRQMVAAAISYPQRLKADAIAWRMRITKEERSMLGLTTIGAIDEGKAARTKRRRERDRQRKERQRRAAGAKPRKAYEGQSVNTARPWESEGISRRTWYRRRTSAIASPDTGPATAKGDI
jgi:hypothetical protein